MRAQAGWGRARRMTAVLLALAALAACGGDDGTSAADDGGSSTTEGSSAEAASFPVTIEHKYGETTIDEAPERVVSVGFSDQDFVLALGVTPVGIREWYGERPFATWEWAQDELGDAEPTVLGSEEIDFEEVAALRPDLIVGVSSGMTEEDYDTLSQIAPTLTQSGDYVDYGMPWQDATRMIGQALGKADAAEAIVTDLEDRFTEAQETYPDLVGASGVIAFVMAEDEVGGYSDQDGRSRILTSLGMHIPQNIIDLAGDAFYVSFSAENIDRLDADLVVWVAGSDDIIAQIKASPLRGGLPASAEGREVFLNEQDAGAASFGSPLSLGYVLDELVPRFAAAVDGDPATPSD